MTSAPSETIEFPDRPALPALVRRVGAALAAGGLVALPTETVYGLAARADRPAALEALRRVKGTRGSRGWTWHVGTPTALESFQELRPLAERLAARYWPGPLTLVLRGVPAGLEGLALDGWTALRMPAHRGTASLLEALDFPVTMTSANRAGEPPAVEARSLAAAFGAQLALVLDGGPSRLGEASGVLRLGPARFELLREGLLGLDELRRVAGLRLLFVCTGNTCRSPMAAALAGDLLRRRLRPPSGDLSTFGFHVGSAGVFAQPGAAASAHAVAAMQARGLDLTAHRSRPADEALLAEADRVYALTRAHLEALRERAGAQLADRLSLLDPGGGDVPDPIGGSREDYEACARRIAEALTERAREWA